MYVDTLTGRPASPNGAAVRASITDVHRKTVAGSVKRKAAAAQASDAMSRKRVAKHVPDTPKNQAKCASGAPKRKRKKKKKKKSARQIHPDAKADQAKHPALREPTILLNLGAGLCLNLISDIPLKIMELLGVPEHVLPGSAKDPIAVFEYSPRDEFIGFVLKECSMLYKLLCTSLAFNGMQYPWKTANGPIHAIGIIAAPTTATPRRLGGALRSHGILVNVESFQLKGICCGDWTGFLELKPGQTLPEFIKLNNHAKPVRIVSFDKMVRCAECGCIPTPTCECDLVKRLKDLAIPMDVVLPMESADPGTENNANANKNQTVDENRNAKMTPHLPGNNIAKSEITKHHVRGGNSEMFTENGTPIVFAHNSAMAKRGPYSRPPQTRSRRSGALYTK